MQGKYTKKKQKKGLMCLLWLAVGAALLAAAVLFFLFSTPEENTDQTVPTLPIEPSGLVIEQNVQLEEVVPVSIDLGNGMEITDIASYTGLYMEDGSDDIVTGVLMIAVTNHGDKTVQYARITMNYGQEQAIFELSTLLPGTSVVLLEQNRMAYREEAEHGFAAASNVAVFDEEPTMQSDRLQIQALDGAFNVTNISGEDIQGDIYIYYKNSAADVFYGGITYRAKIAGGLDAGQIAQVITNHYSLSGSRILFVTVTGE